ncbi:MAG: hypothetical protein IPL40_10335 [Proteobacteria bacterium]|nr:hypothetical protein [Pseudomonadota bacterium]
MQKQLGDAVARGSETGRARGRAGAWLLLRLSLLLVASAGALGAGCGKDQHGLLLTVTATRLVERFDLQVRELATGTIVLDRRDEPVTTTERPNRDISDPTQALRLAVEFSRRGHYLLRLVGRSYTGGERLQVAVREFQVRGLRKVLVKLLPNEHDEDGDGFPDCAAYPDCAGLGDSLSCDFLDCDDHEASVNRFGLEVCGNGRDDDCSAGCVADPSVGDEPCEDADGDGVAVPQDCDDADPCRAPTIKEDANLCAAGDVAAQALRYALPQACRDKLAASGATMTAPFCGDGVDQDCNGRDVACIVDADCDGYPPPADCDDARADVNPGAVEVCDDATDNNCNQVVDEGCVPCDVDGDGHAALGVPPDAACELPKDDCDDFDAGVGPETTAGGAGGAEGGTVLGGLRQRCSTAREKNGQAAREVDHDCDGKAAAADGCPTTACDHDGDGFEGLRAGCNPPAAKLDCDDDDPRTFPGAPDLCNDLVRQNCIADGACAGDRDGDGYVAPADCLDDPASPGAAEVHPWAVELCDGRDNDCDGLVDEGNPDGEGRLIASTAATCSDFSRGECAPGGALTGRCACSRQLPSRDPRYPLDAARTACSGEDERAVASQRCFGATQPQPERCDERDWDCNGRKDDPEGLNLADKGKACSIATGNCTAGTVAGCDWTKTVANADLVRQVVAGAGIVFNDHWLCGDAGGAAAALPVPELCNGQDDNCDGAVPADERDVDGDKYLRCSGCTAAQVSGRFALAAGLVGCGDCNDNVATVFPGASEQCNNVDDNCRNALTDDGADQCGGSTATCCSQISACIDLQSNTSHCGACGTVCDAAVASRCVSGHCECGETGAACGAGLNCVSGQCVCKAGARCGGCCDGNSCVSVPTAALCGLNGATCQVCSAPECRSRTCKSDGSCGSDPLTGTDCADDGLSCTLDKCAAGTCAHTQLVASKCLIGGVCYDDGALNPANSCQVCNAASNARAWSNKALRAGCDDGAGAGRCDNQSVPRCCTKCLHTDGACESSPTAIACGSGGATCSACAGGTTCAPATCTAAGVCSTASAADNTACASDGKDCTKDLCKSGACTHAELEPNTCLIGALCYASGDRSSNTCQACVPATSTSAWTNKLVGAACTSGGDAGRCDGSSPPPDCCTGCLGAGNSCLTGNTLAACGGAGAACQTCSGAGECKVDTCSAGACGIANATDGTGCTADGLSCTRDECSSGSCAHPLRLSRCLIDGTCYNNGDANPANPCQACVSATSTTAWTNNAAQASCPGGRCDASGACCAGCLTTVGNVCVSTPSAAQCGDDGSSCVVCSAAGECEVDVCQADGTCATNTAADTTPCDGDNGQCVAGACIPN